MELFCAKIADRLKQFAQILILNGNQMLPPQYDATLIHCAHLMLLT